MKYPAVVLVALLAFAHSGVSQTAWIAPTSAEVDAVYPDIETLYIDLHRNPELAFHEVQTAAKLAARVKALGYDVTTGVGGTGIVAVMKNGPGPTVMLRTELDALPVEEKTGLPFASQAVVKNSNGQSTPVMHACGHDIHMSAWAGTARLMAEHKDRWQGTLVMVGQPAEEGGGGALAMLKDGLFTRFPRPDFALSLHDDDTMPAGTIGYHPGPFRSMSDTVTIVVHGRGGHAAMPMNTVDPVVLASRIVLALQTIVSPRTIPPTRSSSPSARFMAAHRPILFPMKCAYSFRCGLTRWKFGERPWPPSAALLAAKRSRRERLVNPKFSCATKAPPVSRRFTTIRS